MEDQQKQSSVKIFDELPTFAAPAVPAGSGGDQASVYDLNDNFSIFKVGGDQPQQQQEPQTATKESTLEKELDFSNPDTFVIGKPSVGHFVDLDFSLDPLASTTIDTTSAPKAGTTQANFLDDLDDWSTEEKQPASAEPTKTTAVPAASVGAGGDSNLVNVTNLMDTSCIDNLLSDLPEETDEEDELSNRSAKNDSDWYASGVKPGLTFQEEIITTSSVVFEASQPESVTLLPDQHSFSLGGDDISSGSSLRTSNEEKDMSFSESSFLKEELKSTDEITTTTHTSESPVQQQQPQPSSPVLAASESALPKSAPKGRPSQPPPPPPPVLSSSSSSSSDLGITSGVPQQSSPAPVESSLTFSGIPAAADDDDIITSTSSSSSQAAGLEKAETTISSTSDTSSFLGSAAPPVAIETTAALPPLPLSPPSISSWSPSSSSAATAAPTADLVANTTAARQASIDDDDDDEVPVQTSISSSSYHPQDEQPTSAETIFSAGRDFAPPSAAPFSSASSSDLLPSQSSSADLIKEEEVIKTESEPVKSTWSPPPPPPPSSPPVSQVVKEVPSTTAQEVKKVPVEAPKQPQQQQTTSIMGRKNRRDNSADDGAEQATGSDQVKEYIENVLGPNVAELVYWRDLKNSGAVFGLGLVILFSLSIFSVISVVAYTLFFSLLASLSFRIYKNVEQAVKKTGEGHPFKEYLEIQITPSQERIHEIVESAIIHGTFFVNRLRSVLLVEDIVDSLKYLVIFWAFTYIGAWFNGLTVIILLYLGAFSLPLVYEQNRGQIDQYLELANAKFAEVADKIPFLKKASAVPAEKKEE